MKKNVLKIIIIVLVVLAIMVGMAYLIDLNRMKQGEQEYSYSKLWLRKH